MILRLLCIATIASAGGQCFAQHGTFGGGGHMGGGGQIGGGHRTSGGNFGRNGFPHETQTTPRFNHTPRTSFEEYYECSSCGHRHRSAKPGDRCRGCGVRFDYVDNGDGTTSGSRGIRSYRGLIKLVIFGIIFLVVAGGGAIAAIAKAGSGGGKKSFSSRNPNLVKQTGSAYQSQQLPPQQQQYQNPYSQQARNPYTGAQQSAPLPPQQVTPLPPNDSNNPPPLG